MKKLHICLEAFKAQTGEVFIEGERIDSWQYCNLSFLERLNFKDLNC